MPRAFPSTVLNMVKQNNADMCPIQKTLVLNVMEEWDLNKTAGVKTALRSGLGESLLIGIMMTTNHLILIFPC
jgi:hypothetical protein